MFDYSLSDIRALYGTTAYNRGRDYCDSGRVISLELEENEDWSDTGERYNAVVQGNKKYKVTVDIDGFGEIETNCTCPAYGSYYYEGCKHIAAVLIAIYRRNQGAAKQEANKEKERLAQEGLSIRGPNSMLNHVNRTTSGFSSLPQTNSRQNVHTFPVSQGSINSRQQKPPAVSYAAADQMMKILDVRKTGPDEAPAAANTTMSTSGKDTLQVEYIIKVMDGYNVEDYLALEMKIGVKRTYIVQKIRDFLDALDRGESYPFTKIFTFDQTSQVFLPEDQAIMDILLRVRANERLMKKTINPYSSSLGTHEDPKRMYIPPIVWDQLLDKLVQAKHVIWEGKGTLGNAQLEQTEGLPPIQYKITPGQEDGYVLKVEGVDRLALLENYGVVLESGKLFKMEPRQIRQLSKLKSTLSAYGGKGRIELSARQIEPFLQHTLPVLRQLGQVRLDKQVQQKIQEPELAVKAFLDQEDDSLVLRAEFHYGDIVIDPLSPAPKQRKSEEIILIRHGEREQRVLRLLEETSMSCINGRWLASTNEQMYEMLYLVLPALEELAELYVSQSVQQFRQRSASPMKLKADLTQGLDWLELNFELEGIEAEEISHILKHIVEKKKYVRLRDGVLLSLEGQAYDEIRTVVEQLDLKRDQAKQGVFRIPGLRALQLFHPEETKSKAVRLGKTLRQFLERLLHPERMSYELPASLEPILRDYQAEGFQWFKNLSCFGFGGILADDMGLGKTLQTIAYIRSELDERAAAAVAGAEAVNKTGAEASTGVGDRPGNEAESGSRYADPAVQQPVLIITPASLTYNWENELRRFAPELKVAVAAGDKEQRSSLMEDMHAQAYDVLITSYPLLRRDAEWYKDRDFPILILDEAQAIKNSGSQTAQLVKQLSAQHRFALTGTPIENSLQELWSIFEAVFPALFHGQKHLHELPRERIARMISPFLLRRLKQDVLEELPDRIDTIHRSALTKEQKKLYLAYMARLREDTLKDLETEGFQKSRIRILAGITRLRQLCCHPSLFIENYKGTSGKLEQLLELVADGLVNGRRFLIFSQFSSMLGLIRTALQEHGHQAFYLDGSTPASERVEMSRRFNEGEHDIFLVSLKAGGTGLNLTGADTVVLFDLWWNPAVEEQAAGRAHRMGQRKIVQVFRMVAEGTIEEKMLELQQKKKDLIEDVLNSSTGNTSAMSEEDIRELLNM
ncbi:SNF2 helicase associated domain-containing protein [Paenibacillus terreus]|uniref:SNF2 helicase associated domain-containing protein n=1 Tax=Paenibacillus terreus TaxID=1387834 RepID=A0ABV5BFT0_9BACL